MPTAAIAVFTIGLVTLSVWLRDLYIPLGGNRRGRLHEIRNIIITMAITVSQGSSAKLIHFDF